MSFNSNASRILFLFFSLFLLTAGPVPASAQTGDPAAMKAQAKALVDALKLTDALPIYEKLATLTPNDPEVHYYLGLSILGPAANTSDPEAVKKLRVRARQEFVRAQQLGDISQLLKGFIEGIPADGSAGAGFSDNAEANSLMQKGESAFSSGKLDDALANYIAALKIDPRCYHAALFAGDVHTQRSNFSEASNWYKKAIEIDGNIETAYRYSATPLMKQGKYDQARDLYIEAFIVEPYSRLALSGIIQWGQMTKTPLGHPKIDVPEIKIGPAGKANTTINVNPLSDDGSMAWMSYVTTRELWR